MTQMQHSDLDVIIVFLFPGDIRQIGLGDEVATQSSRTLLTSEGLGHDLQSGQWSFPLQHNRISCISHLQLCLWGGLGVAKAKKKKKKQWGKAFNKRRHLLSKVKITCSNHKAASFKNQHPSVSAADDCTWKNFQSKCTFCHYLAHLHSAPIGFWNSPRCFIFRVGLHDGKQTVWEGISHMDLGIISLTWELGQPCKMFAQILPWARSLIERGHFWNSASRLALHGLIAGTSSLQRLMKY